MSPALRPFFTFFGGKYRDIDFPALGEWCRTRSGQVMVCENVGATWLPFTPFRDIKGTAGRGRTGVSKEALWMPDIDLLS